MSSQSESLIIKRVIFVDSCIQECQSLVNGLSHEFTAFQLRPDHDGISQITAALDDQGLRQMPEHTRFSIHLFTHGFPGGIQLGGSNLYFAQVQHDAERLKAWFPVVRSSLFLYGYGIVESDRCEHFLRHIHAVTGANVATSTLQIGDASVNRSWEADRFSSVSFSSGLTTKKTSLC